MVVMRMSMLLLVCKLRSCRRRCRRRRVAGQSGLERCHVRRGGGGRGSADRGSAGGAHAQVQGISGGVVARDVLLILVLIVMRIPTLPPPVLSHLHVSEAESAVAQRRRLVLL